MAEPVKKNSAFRAVAQDDVAANPDSMPESSSVPQASDLHTFRQSPEIVTRDLTLYFANRLVLNQISLSIAPNSVTSIIGPTGTGKSTFLRCINRTNDMLDGVRTTGEILLDGQNINDSGTDVAKLRKRVALQNYAIFPTTVFENVAYGPRVAGVVTAANLREAVETGLRRAGLWDELSNLLDKRASRLSLGQQYRLCIARALATDPDVLLLDEPALALDPRATARLEDLIFELKNRLTIVTVMNSVQQAATISDFTVFLLKGQLIEAGPTTDLFTNPKDRRTEDYVRGRFE